MSAVLTVLSNIVITLLSAVMFTMILRAVFSLFAPDSDHPVVNVVFNVTDVIMAPARALLDKTGWFRNSVIDMGYMFTIVFLWIIFALFTLLG